MNEKTKKAPLLSVRELVEGAVMLALAAVLSFIIVYKLPWGGSITMLSMLPIALFSIKRGVKKGLVVSFLYSLFQLWQGITDGLFAWGLTPVMLIACIFLDYLAAFTAIGLSGMFKGKGIKGWIGGTALALLLRFCCHTFSGVVIFESAGLLWEGFSTDNSILYSILYNGSYMLPEIAFTCLGAAVIFAVPQMRRLMTTSE